MSGQNKKPQHHIRQEVCLTRAPYREGRKPTAVKVYTIHQESKYLLVQGVPVVGATRELMRLFEQYGDLEDHRLLEDYPGEQFQEVHFFKYQKIQSARFAKKKLDDWSFYGGVLHVCYAPEYESLEDTRHKLRERQRVIQAKVRQYKKDGTYDLYPHASKLTTDLEEASSTNHHHGQQQQQIRNKPPWHRPRKYGRSRQQAKPEYHRAEVQQTSQFEMDESTSVDTTGQPHDQYNTSHFGTMEQVRDSSFTQIQSDNHPEASELHTALRESLTSVPYHNWQQGNIPQSSTSYSEISNNTSRSHFDTSTALVPHTGHASHNTVPTRTQNFSETKGTKGVRNIAVEQARAMQFYGKTHQNISDQTSEQSESRNDKTRSNENESSQEHTLNQAELTNETSEFRDSTTGRGSSLHTNVGVTIFSGTNIGNKRRGDSTIISTNIGGNLTDRVTDLGFNENQQLILPPPPKRRRTGFRLNQPVSSPAHAARVPSAQAIFPPGFDARLNIPEIPNTIEPETEISDETNLSLQVSTTSTASNISNQKTDNFNQNRAVGVSSYRNSDIESSFSSSKPNPDSENRTDNNSITAKKLNIPIPRFVPRQAVPRKKTVQSGTATDTGKSNGEIDRVNIELKKNALTLGRVQGPKYVGPESDKIVNTADQSVNKTVKDIRKKLKEIT